MWTTISGYVKVFWIRNRGGKGVEFIEAHLKSPLRSSPSLTPGLLDNSRCTIKPPFMNRPFESRSGKTRRWTPPSPVPSPLPRYLVSARLYSPAHVFFSFNCHFGFSFLFSLLSLPYATQSVTIPPRKGPFPDSIPFCNAEDLFRPDRLQSSPPRFCFSFPAPPSPLLFFEHDRFPQRSEVNLYFVQESGAPSYFPLDLLSPSRASSPHDTREITDVDYSTLLPADELYQDFDEIRSLFRAFPLYDFWTRGTQG